MKKQSKRKFKQGIFNPKNPQKWIITKSFDLNEKAIKYRSSYELKFMKFIDMNPDIVLANSEGIVIPYVSPIDNKLHRYYIDFIIKNKKGKIFLVEIKPFNQTQKPKQPKSKSGKSYKNYIEAYKTYLINQAKWKTASEFAKSKGWEFKIITEKELF